MMRIQSLKFAMQAASDRLMKAQDNSESPSSLLGIFCCSLVSALHQIYMLEI